MQHLENIGKGMFVIGATVPCLAGTFAAGIAGLFLMLCAGILYVVANYHRIPTTSIRSEFVKPPDDNIEWRKWYDSHYKKQ